MFNETNPVRTIAMQGTQIRDLAEAREKNIGVNAPIDIESVATQTEGLVDIEAYATTPAAINEESVVSQSMSGEAPLYENQVTEAAPVMSNAADFNTNASMMGTDVIVPQPEYQEPAPMITSEPESVATQDLTIQASQPASLEAAPMTDIQAVATQIEGAVDIEAYATNLAAIDNPPSQIPYSNEYVNNPQGAPAIQTTQAESGLQLAHVVQQGDSIDSLCQRYLIPRGSLLAANNLPFNGTIIPGMTLLLPKADGLAKYEVAFYEQVVNKMIKEANKIINSQANNTNSTLNGVGELNTAENTFSI